MVVAVAVTGRPAVPVVVEAEVTVPLAEAIEVERRVDRTIAAAIGIAGPGVERIAGVVALPARIARVTGEATVGCAAITRRACPHKGHERGEGKVS